MFAEEALDKILNEYEFDEVLDLGCGVGIHTAEFLEKGKQVTSVDNHCLGVDHPMNDHYLMDVSEFMDNCTDKFDVIWCSHILEHTPNVQNFLSKCYELLKTGGVICITVPPMKEQIVGGHLNLFNEGLLLYRLVLAGFDCRNARVSRYGYNVSVIVEKSDVETWLNLFKILKTLHTDDGDIEKLEEYFPMPVFQGFNGRTGNIRWRDK